MSTSISAVSCAASYSVGQTCTLSEATKAKLDALGITVTDGMTKSQAQAKIKQAEAAQQQSQNQNGGQQNSSESEIISQAKALASKVGVTVSADVSEILDDISVQLESLMRTAEGNPSRLAVLSSYMSELTSLNSEYSSVQSSQQSMYAAMNMVSTSNKIALGLS